MESTAPAAIDRPLRWLTAARVVAALSTATVLDPVVSAISTFGPLAPRTVAGVALALVVAGCTARVCWTSIPPPQRVAAPVALTGLVVGSVVAAPVLTSRWVFTAPFFLLSGLLLSLRGLARLAAAVAVFAGVFVTARVDHLDLPKVGGFAVMLAGFAVVLTGLIGVLEVYLDLHTAQDDVRRLAGDAERMRLAAELHDSLSQDLVRVALNCDLAAALLPEGHPEVRAALAAASADTRDALRGVREVISGERRDDVHDELRTGARLLQARGIEVVVLGQPPAVDVFRWVVREGLTNVVKHSVGARLCQVRFANTDERCELRITDDGTGQPAGAVTEGAGLTGLRRRVESSGGELAVTAQRGQTTLLVRLPVVPR